MHGIYFKEKKCKNITKVFFYFFHFGLFHIVPRSMMVLIKQTMCWWKLVGRQFLSPSHRQEVRCSSSLDLTAVENIQVFPPCGLQVRASILLPINVFGSRVPI